LKGVVKYKLDIVAGHEMVYEQYCERVYLEVLVASTADTLVLRRDANFYEKPVKLVRLPA